jgi:hypothetical protein
VPSSPKRPTFVHWLRASGQISDEDLRLLSNEWNQTKPSGFKVYTTGPTTWDQFVASKYPRKVLAYQAYLRLIGATPLTLMKD